MPTAPQNPPTRFSWRGQAEPRLIDAFILTLSCPDRAGIVHAVTGLLAAQGGDISEAAQFNDQDTGLFFMRACPPSPWSASSAIA